MQCIVETSFLSFFLFLLLLSFFYSQTQGRPELRTRRKILINRCINVSTLLEKFKPASPEAEPAPAPEPEAEDDVQNPQSSAEDKEAQGPSKVDEPGDSVDGEGNNQDDEEIPGESSETEQHSSKAAL